MKILIYLFAYLALLTFSGLTLVHPSKPTVLFDGSNLTAWRGFHSDSVPYAWHIEDGALKLEHGGAGDLISRETFTNFDLSFDWKISEAGNSGVFILVKDSAVYKHTYDTGLEYQLLDNRRHSDNKKLTHHAGSLYDMIAADSNFCKSAGKYNKGRIVLNKGHLIHYLNGHKTVDVYLWTSDWNTLVAKSKFKDFLGFARYHQGHIALQDHGNQVWLKNIKIIKL